MKPILRWAIVDKRGVMYRDNNTKASKTCLKEWNLMMPERAPFRAVRVQVVEVVR